MLCGKCNSEISDTAKFCSQCGWVLLKPSEREKDFIEYERKYLDRLSGKEESNDEIKPIPEKVEAIEPISGKQVTGWLTKMGFFLAFGLLTGIFLAAIGW
jgi:hypothetical protein